MLLKKIKPTHPNTNCDEMRSASYEATEPDDHHMTTRLGRVCVIQEYTDSAPSKDDGTELFYCTT